MPEITFVFGPNNTFFFDCPKTWKFHNIPQTLRQLFNSSMSPEWRIAQPFCLALGPQINSPEPIWYAGAKVLGGEEKIFYSQSYFDFNYPDLSRWTKTVPNAARACFVTFGDGLSYFACAPGYGSVWAGVPSELTDKVQKAFDTPCCVSLGIDQSWFVLWPDGYCSWKFHGHYGELDKILNEATPRTVSYLAISPYNKHHFFVAFKDRSIRYNFTGAPEWMPQMQEVFKGWEAEIMQKQTPQQQHPPAQPQFNQWAPPPPAAQPTYIAAHYANAHSPPPPPQFSAYSPYGDSGAHQNAVELPDNSTLLAPPPVPPQPAPPVQNGFQRSASTEKKKRFLSKLF